MVEPGRARAFARALGKRAKTDPIDAAVLTAFGQAVRPAPSAAPSAQQQRLGELVLRRRQFVELPWPRATARPITPSRSRAARQRHCCAACARRSRRARRPSPRRSRTIDDESPRRAAPRSARHRPRDRRGHAGGGDARTGHARAKAAAALAGVAPYNCDSGPSNGTRHIRGGRGPGALRALYGRDERRAPRWHPPGLPPASVAAGKKPLVALTAAMRKLVVLLNRMLKSPQFKLRAASGES